MAQASEAKGEVQLGGGGKNFHSYEKLSLECVTVNNIHRNGYARMDAIFTYDYQCRSLLFPCTFAE